MFLKTLIEKINYFVNYVHVSFYNSIYIHKYTKTYENKIYVLEFVYNHL